MQFDNPHISSDAKPRWVTSVERVVMAILIIIACVPIITIPFVLGSFEKDRADKATRERWHVIHLAILGTCVVLGFLLTFFLFFSAYTPTQVALDSIPDALWDSVKSRPQLLLVSLACTATSFLAMNRLATSILHHEEGDANSMPRAGWDKLLAVFRWKGPRNGIVSGNETLWKVKTAAAWAALASLGLIVLTPLAMDSSIMKIIEALEKMDSALFRLIEDEEYIVPGVYLVAAGGLFSIASTATWFYTGRLFGYQAIHDIARGKPSAWALRIAGYVVSAMPFLPLLATFCGVTALGALIVTTAGSGVAIGGWLVIARRFEMEPANLVLDPKVAQGKHLAPVVAIHEDRIKKACFGFLVAAVVGLTAITALTWFRTTAAYAMFVEPHEWGYYTFLGAIITAGPVVLLFFLRSVYARRALMVYLAAIVLLLVVACVSYSPFRVEPAQLLHAIVFGNRIGYTSYSGSLTTSDRPLHIILIMLFTCIAAAAFMVIKRKAIPIEITTPKHASFSSWRNMRAFMFTSTRRRATRENVVLLGMLVVLSGMLVTFQPPASIVLPRDPSNDMRVSFWSYNSRVTLPDSTLQILGNNHARLFGGVGAATKVQGDKCAAYGVELVQLIEMPKNQQHLATVIARADSFMDTWASLGFTKNPYIGFVFDQEDMNGLHEFKEAYNEEASKAVQDLQSYLASRGYQLFMTEYMLTIGDLLDGDADLANNNLDPIDFTWNITQFDWMLYRAESAIAYNEPHAMFTYEWARFMKAATMQLGGEALFKKTSFSIGVANDDMPLYRDPGGLDELLLDAKICQAMGIPAINVFQLGEKNGDEFLGKWGDAGLQRFFDELRTFSTVAFTFERRATFFGNLKGTDNPTGSVFGFFFQDAFLDAWVGFLAIPWIVVLVVSPLVLAWRGRFKPPAPRLATKRAYSNDWIDRALIIARVALYAMLWLLPAWTGAIFFNPTFF